MEPWLQLNHEFPALVLILGVKSIPEKNQYPPSFYGPIIKQTLDSIVGEIKHPTEKSSIQSNTRSGKVALFIQYREKGTEDNASALHKINAPCTIILTLRKLKTVLPSLKPPVEKMLKIGLVYRLMCPRCPRATLVKPADISKSTSRELVEWSPICPSGAPPSLKRT